MRGTLYYCQRKKQLQEAKKTSVVLMSDKDRLSAPGIISGQTIVRDE
jgi:hypothetical protein